MICYNTQKRSQILKDSAYNPIRRMFFIDQKIRENKYPNCKSVAEEFGVERRSVLRDIAFMRDQLQAPIEYSYKKRGYFYLEPTYYLPTVYLTMNHAVSLKMLEEIISQYKEVPFAEELEGILKNLFAYSPFLEFTTPIKFMQRALPCANREVLEIFQRAVISQMCVKMDYYSAKNGETTRRQVAPYDLVNHHGVYYLFAFCYLRSEMRLFAIHRCSNLQQLQELFEKQDVSAAEYLEKSFDLSRDDDKEYFVKLKFSAYQARWIRERIWHPSQKIEEQQDGSLILSFSVIGLRDTKSWVLYHGAEVEVLAPKKLRQEVYQEYQKALELYQ